MTSQSASSTEASILRRTNPTATPTRTRPFMMAAIRNISPTALHLEDRVPPPLPFPCDLKEPTMFANDCSVHTGTPREATLL
ncbi:hypothetical protein EUGRSUZ_I01214 [Eucalyptus grandis]|uniref:Uncharacterized protein n=2 Tax=Eucalyptus grandis TaxID=71139 RepID=A0ACC3JF19_EUCGR|nr:hypothetical protein EUGRSUZ_I01214 [Eucalyptus grandis]